MILQYLKKKENKEQIIATKQYKQIISESKIFLNDNNFFTTKDYSRVRPPNRLPVDVAVLAKIGPAI